MKNKEFIDFCKKSLPKMVFDFSNEEGIIYKEDNTWIVQLSVWKNPVQHELLISYRPDGIKKGRRKTKSIFVDSFDQKNWTFRDPFYNWL